MDTVCSTNATRRVNHKVIVTVTADPKLDREAVIKNTGPPKPVTSSQLEPEASMMSFHDVTFRAHGLLLNGLGDNSG